MDHFINVCLHPVKANSKAESKYIFSYHQTLIPAKFLSTRILLNVCSMIDLCILTHSCTLSVFFEKPRTVPSHMDRLQSNQIKPANGPLFIYTYMYSKRREVQRIAVDTALKKLLIHLGEIPNRHEKLHSNIRLQ